MYINRQKFIPAGKHFVNKHKRFKNTVVLSCTFLFGFILYLLYLVSYLILALYGGLGFKILTAHSKYGCIKHKRLMHLEPAKPYSRSDIRSSMGFREHILDFKAAVDIPFRDIMLTHILLHFFCKKLRCLTLTGYLHDLEGKLRLYPVIEKVGHNRVTGTDHV